METKLTSEESRSLSNNTESDISKAFNDKINHEILSKKERSDLNTY